MAENIPFYKVGQVGVNLDLPSEELPPQTWSDVLNVRFEDGKILRGNGYAEVFLDQMANPAYWVMPAYAPTQNFWIYSDLENLYLTDGLTHVNVTRVSGGIYNVNDRILWNGGRLSGIPVITDFFDPPQAMLNVGLANNFQDLPNWPANTLCKSIKPYKNFLIALNITKGADNFQNLVKWSHPAAPGTVPETWDETDPTHLAGENELGDEEPGGIQDGLILRDSFIIYKDNATWGMQFIGGNQVFRFYPIFTASGILAPGCVSPIRNGTMHFVATGDDLIIHDGQNITSVIDTRMKRYLRRTLSQFQFDRSFTFPYTLKDEAWFCFPAEDAVFPNMAIVWNWRDDTIAIRNFEDEMSFADTGPVSAGGQVWNLATQIWDTDNEIWDKITFRVHFENILGASPTPNKLFQLDTSQAMNSNGYTTFVERTGIALIGQDRTTGELKADHMMRKICTRIWIKAKGDPFQVQVGSHEENDSVDPPIYAPAQTFTPGVTKYLDFCVDGRYMAVKFFVEDDVGTEFEIEGYNLEIALLGEQ